MSGQTIRGGPQEPVPIKTLLGWVLSGPLKVGKLDYYPHASINFVSSSIKSEKHQIIREQDEWGHVSGLENPADLGSRGVTLRQLVENKLWLEGPKWLIKHEEEWPKTMVLMESEDANG